MAPEVRGGKAQWWHWPGPFYFASACSTAEPCQAAPANTAAAVAAENTSALLWCLGWLPAALTVLCSGSPFPQTQREARQDNRHSPGGGAHLPGHSPVREVAPDLAEAAGWGADVADALLPGGWCFTQELWGKNVEFCPTCVWVAAVTGPIVTGINFLFSDIGLEGVSGMLQSVPCDTVQVCYIHAQHNWSVFPCGNNGSNGIEKIEACFYFQAAHYTTLNLLCF